MIFKKCLLLLAAAIFFVLGNTRPGCTVTVNGQDMDKVFSPMGVLRAEVAAVKALDEIAEGKAQLPVLKKRYRLCLAPADGDLKTLSHRIICDSAQADVLDRVAVGSEILGFVESGAILKERLHQYAYDNMPPWAKDCRLSEKLCTRSFYCRSETKWDYEEMVCRILETAALIYSA